MSEEITTEEGYWSNGDISSRVNFKNEKWHSLCEGYYENGNLEFRKNYKNGKKHGLCEWWHKDGNLRYREYYFNDKEVTEFEYDVLEASKKKSR